MNIYFSGIGGVGIGPLAEIAFDAGYEVAGSDLEESLVTKQLRQNGIKICIGQDGSFLKSQHDIKPIDWFVHTAALPANHPELALARKLGIHTAKRDELLAQIIADKGLKLIAVAGTHGKTTTTGMLIWAFQQLKVPVSYSIGTTINFGPSGKFNPASRYFIYECDEFDRNFLNFKPYLSIITSIDYDHPDTYKTVDDYLDAFRQFSTNSGQVIAWDDQHEEIFDDLLHVSLLNPLDINANLKIAGLHNRRNATIAQTAIRQLGFIKNTNDIFMNFPGTDRRFEKLSPNLYSDYGHHPVEIAATLQLARELSDNVVLVYQPHQNIRQHKIRNQYTDQFELADEIYWLPTYLSREDKDLPILKPSELIQNITNINNVHIAEFDDNLWQVIKNAQSEGKLVLGMGAGKIDSWLRERLTI